MATLRLTLEIDRGAEPISGHLTGPRDQRREFCGWTALAATIDSAINSDSEPQHHALQPRRVEPHSQTGEVR